MKISEVTVKIKFKHNKLYEFLALLFAGIGLKKASIYFSNKWIKSIKFRVDKGQWKSAGMEGRIQFE